MSAPEGAVNPLRFCAVVTNQHALGGDLTAQIDGELSIADAARDLGWDGVAVTQHFLTGAWLHGIDQVAMLGRLIDRTGDMSLVVSINLLALHNPVATAEQFASIDVLSGGRLVFGAGLGYRDEEYLAFGIDRKRMVERFEGNLAALKELWTSDEPVVDLPWCQVQGTPISTRPLQEPRPPILMAANADKAVVRAALQSDGWMINPHATYSTVARQLDLFAATRQEAGLPASSRTSVAREIFCAPTRQRALEIARPFLGAKYDAYAAWGQDKALPGDESFAIPFELLEDERFIIGTPDDCIAMLIPWIDDLHMTDFGFRTNWFGMPHEHAVESMRLLTTEVFPALREGR